MKKLGGFARLFFGWFFGGALLLGGVAMLGDTLWTGLLCILAGVVLLPIAPVRGLFGLFRGKKTLVRSLSFVVLFLAAALCLPEEQKSGAAGGLVGSPVVTQRVDVSQGITPGGQEALQPTEPETEQNTGTPIATPTGTGAQTITGTPIATPTGTGAQTLTGTPIATPTGTGVQPITGTPTTSAGPTTGPAPEPPTGFVYQEVPPYQGMPYVILHDNLPYFTEAELTTEPVEVFAPLDALGRCGVCYASVCPALMPTEPRGEIGAVRPSGWHTLKFDFVDGKYLYNRCHLLGFQLTGENANTRNLITGTRYLNVEGMLPFENMVADYVKETGNHVFYRVTPVFVDEELVARGVLMEGYSIEDAGEGICFCVFAYNVQPYVTICYADGTAVASEEALTVMPTPTKAPTPTPMPTPTKAPTKDPTKAPTVVPTKAPTATPTPTPTKAPTAEPTKAAQKTYVLNTNTHKFHTTSCRYVKSIKAENRWDYTGTAAEILAMGYEPCKSCNPR